MPDRVKKVRFGVDPAQSDKEREEVAGFNCGDEPWAQDINTWVRGTNPEDSVWEDLKWPGARVWLYYNQAGQLVGVGALGQNDWSTKKKEGKRPVTIITNFAVDKNYHRQPQGEGETSYAKQILRDLRAEAEKDKAERPQLCLCVHPDSPVKARLYEPEGWEVVVPPTVKSNGYYRMSLDLNKPPRR